jgi:hypothetical protein
MYLSSVNPDTTIIPGLTNRSYINGKKFVIPSTYSKYQSAMPIDNVSKSMEGRKM